MANLVTKAMYEQIKNKTYTVIWFKQETGHRVMGYGGLSIIRATKEIFCAQKAGYISLLVTNEVGKAMFSDLEPGSRGMREETRMTYQDCAEFLKKYDIKDNEQ